MAELSHKLKKRINNYYEKDGDITYIYTYNNNLGYNKVSIDTEDLNKVLLYKWYIRKQSNVLYCEANNNDNTTTKIKLHRLIMNTTNNKEIIDHINRDGLDNRKSNLRIVNTSINAKNIRTPKNNKTNFTGVVVLKSGHVEARWINKKPVRRIFSIKKYGLKKAINLAIVSRYENTINLEYVYDENQIQIYNNAKKELKI